MVGVDIVLVSRVYKAIKSDKFYDRVLNEEEKDYLLTRRHANKEVEAKSFAGLYAAKEAILKAFKVGITNGYSFKDITIVHTELGAPVVRLSDRLNKLLHDYKKTDVNLSISHDGEYAIAMAILS